MERLAKAQTPLGLPLASDGSVSISIGTKAIVLLVTTYLGTPKARTSRAMNQAIYAGFGSLAVFEQWK